MGGLSRKARQFAREAEEHQLPLLKVDGGGLLFDQLRPYAAEVAQAKVAAAGVVRAYNLIGYDAVGVGGLDLAGGLEFLREQAGRSTFAWLSANLLDRVSNKPLFTPFVSRQVGRTRVAIIGLTSPAIQSAGLLAEQAVIRDWSEVLPTVLAQVAPSHDFIILLTDLPAPLCGVIARRFPALNLIVAAGGGMLNQEPRLLTPTTLLTATGKQGRYVGALACNWRPGRNWSDGVNLHLRVREQEAELARTTSRLAELREQPELVSQIGNLERRRGVLLETLAELRQRREAEPYSYFTNTFTAMGAGVGEEVRVAALVMETRAAISALGQENAARFAGAEPVLLPGFSGWRVCAACHGPATAKWQATGHAEAYATLVGKNRQFNQDCLPCHVTGSEFAKEGQLLALAPELRGVGCEVCHGPGRAHAEGQGQPKPPPVSVNICQGCHTPEHDDDFEYARDVMKIKCSR